MLHVKEPEIQTKQNVTSIHYAAFSHLDSWTINGLFPLFPLPLSRSSCAMIFAWFSSIQSSLSFGFLLDFLAQSLELFHCLSQFRVWTSCPPPDDDQPCWWFLMLPSLSQWFILSYLIWASCPTSCPRNLTVYPEYQAPVLKSSCRVSFAYYCIQGL